MEGSIKELAIYRMERAEEMLHDSEQNYKMKQDWRWQYDVSIYDIK